MRRLFWTAWYLAAAFLLLVLGCLVMAGAATGAGRPKPIQLGNRRIPEKQPEKTKIAIFGDTQKGLAAFAKLAERAKGEGVDLAIHTGDLVSHADVGHYDLALKWVERARFGVPFVVTPGNHDIKGGEHLFEERIGPRQMAFRWGPVDIVIVDNATGPPDVAAVEKMLVHARGPILLFMHVPPLDGPNPKPAYEKFLKLIKNYPVVYVFSGHVHGYARTERDGVVYIYNGVGGDSDSWEYDQKAHMTIVEASSQGIRAREISIDPVFSFSAHLEHLAIGHVGEVVLRRKWGIPALLVLILLLFLGRRTLRKKPQKEPEKETLKLRFTSSKTSDPPDIVI